MAETEETPKKEETIKSLLIKLIRLTFKAINIFKKKKINN